MILFFLAFLALYGGLNAYIYWVIASGLGHHSGLVAAVLAFLVGSPFLGRFLEKRRAAPASTIVAWLGYHWMGIAFLFACFALLFDLAQLTAAPQLTDAQALVGSSGLSIIAALYGFVEARRVRTRHVTVRSPELSYSEETPFRVVQISDLHLGFGSLGPQIEKILEKIGAIDPDLLVSTGDLFDSNLDQITPFVDRLAALSPRHGKIAVIGNHEVYAGLSRTTALTKLAGFRVLSSEAHAVDAHFYVVGVDDPEALGDTSPEGAEAMAFSQVPGDAFSLLLKHRPEIHSQTTGRAALQLSGHTHGGQIFPFIFLTRLQYRARHGLSKPGDRFFLYLSRGTGTWGPQIRLFAPPEITVFDLSHGDRTRVEMTEKFRSTPDSGPPVQRA